MPIPEVTTLVLLICTAKSKFRSTVEISPPVLTTARARIYGEHRDGNFGQIAPEGAQLETLDTCL
eukprot:SAG31_NODE_23232_length_507_cov_1.432763_1_plen_64_part_10